MALTSRDIKSMFPIEMCPWPSVVFLMEYDPGYCDTELLLVKLQPLLGVMPDCVRVH